MGRAGFRIARIRYYTPLIGAFVENIAMRMAERAIGSWAARSTTRGTAAPQDPDHQRTEEARLARTAAKRTLAAKGAAISPAADGYGPDDVGRLDLRARPHGTFFVLLERTHDGAAAARRGDT